MTTTVSQEAREAAASILPSIYGALYSPAMGERCVRGIMDEGFLVQAFHEFEQSIRQQAERGEVVAWQRRLKYPLASDPAGKIYQWEQCSAREATGHFEREAGYEYRPLYTLPTPPEAS